MTRAKRVLTARQSETEECYIDYVEILLEEDVKYAVGEDRQTELLLQIVSEIIGVFECANKIFLSAQCGVEAAIASGR